MSQDDKQSRKKLRVGLFFGGKSDEREVSLSTGRTIAEHLDSDKYEVVPVEISKQGKFLLESKTVKQIAEAVLTRKVASTAELLPIEQGRKGKIDIALLALHGPGGEDGTIQGMLELLGIPYTFSGTLASALAMDKAKTKRMAASVGIPVLPHLVISRHESDKNLDKFVKEIKGKVVVKPNTMGSSIAVTITGKRDEIKQGLKSAFKQSEQVLIEPFIEGREITVPVLGNREAKPLPTVEIKPWEKSGFYDYKAKYERGGSEHIIPAEISKDLENSVQEMAVEVHKLLDCRGVTRSDFILDKQDNFYFLEINTIPGMTPTSLVPDSAKAAGISYGELLDKLIQLGLEE